jgi:DNA-binding response OmpR family regulator
LGIAPRTEQHRKKGEIVGTCQRILIVEDDEPTRNLTGLMLRRAGYEVLLAEDSLQALDIWRKQSPDLIILDVMIPVLDGLEVCRIIRKVSDVPVIFLTAKGEEQDVVNGFDAGAYDYIVKPFRPNELIARIQAILKRKTQEFPPLETILRFEELELDLKAHQIHRRGEVVQLSRISFKLLSFLMQHTGQVITKEELLNQVWGYTNFSGDLNLVETAIKRLRKEIEDNPKEPHFIQTVWGTGYRFVAQKTAPAVTELQLKENGSPITLLSSI